ncbi:HIT family protein [Pendulispora rubella]|uniref:HIT family protein n=1 Tax=Pendulispora rubella TaxID=2741070 RepID=A0ABZ2KZI7_9BACT
MACIFCDIISGKLPASLVYDHEDFLAFLDKKPLFHGHVLLVPRTHVATMTDLPRDPAAKIFAVAQDIARAVESAMEAEGTFVAINNRVSQSVPHLHMHIVPRKKGDGLKGFFWPRTKYASDQETDGVAARIRERL